MKILKRKVVRQLNGQNMNNSQNLLVNKVITFLEKDFHFMKQEISILRTIISVLTG